MNDSAHTSMVLLLGGPYDGTRVDFDTRYNEIRMPPKPEFKASLVGSPGIEDHDKPTFDVEVYRIEPITWNKKHQRSRRFIGVHTDKSDESILHMLIDGYKEVSP